VFRTRCPKAFEKCPLEVPPLKPIDADTQAACWLY